MANIQWLLQVRIFICIWTDYVVFVSGLIKCFHLLLCFLLGFYIEVLKHNVNNWSFTIWLPLEMFFSFLVSCLFILASNISFYILLITILPVNGSGT